MLRSNKITSSQQSETAGAEREIQNMPVRFFTVVNSISQSCVNVAEWECDCIITVYNSIVPKRVGKSHKYDRERERERDGGKTRTRITTVTYNKRHTVTLCTTIKIAALNIVAVVDV